MVVVSGGGWGVGDVEGAVREIARIPGVSAIVCLAGRNEQLLRATERGLRRRVARARIWLHRTDARNPRRRRHARALHRRCDLPGGKGHRHAGRVLRPARRSRSPEHARDGRPGAAAPRQRHAQELGEQVRASFAEHHTLRGRTEHPREGLLAVAGQNTIAAPELADADLPAAAVTASRLAGCVPRRSSAGRRRLPSPQPGGAAIRVEPQLALDPAAVDLVLDAPRRVRPIPLWRLRLIAFVTQFVLLLAISTWLMSTDEVTAVAGAVPGVHRAQAGGHDQCPRWGLVVRASPPARCRCSRTSSVALGIHVSFADNGARCDHHDRRTALAARRTHARTAAFGLAVSLGAHARRAALARPTRSACATASTSCSPPKG